MISKHLNSSTPQTFIYRLYGVLNSISYIRQSELREKAKGVWYKRSPTWVQELGLDEFYEHY